MGNSFKLNDSELIDHNYAMAGEEISKNVIDFRDLNKWGKVVLKMDNPLKFKYLICNLDLQVYNGGFIQYYDNNYGIFCHETAIALKIIGADLASNLVVDSINILDRIRNPEVDLQEFISSNQYSGNDEIEFAMSKLDDEFYKSYENQNIGILLANYLRLN